MPTPLIGITTYGADEERKFPLPREYVDAVRRAGAMPVLVPPGELATAELLSMFDGLILAGGGDLDPQHYGGNQHETIYMLDSERDNSELALARHAIESGLPTFGICRGTQIINVVLGGTLHEHLPDVKGDEIDHRLPPREPTPHSITVTSGTMLAEITVETEFISASWHHQAIRDVAPGLEVTAHAPDGTIEAIEMAEHPWLIGVQWHPELTAETEPIQQRLFNRFVEATKQLKK